MTAANEAISAVAAERRDYFRINERAMLGMRVIEAGEREQAIRALQQGDAPRERVDDLLLSIDAQLQQQLAGISSANAAVASALALMNRKLSLLERMVRTVVTDGSADAGPLPEQVVNLSAGGFAVESRSALAPDTQVEVELVLLPSYRYLRAFGRVVDCRPSDESQGWHRVAVMFEVIRESDRDLLVQHVLGKQSLVLRASRMTPD